METHKLFTCMEIDHSMFRPTSGFEVRSKYYDECLEKAFRKWLARTLKGKNKKILCMFGPPGCGKTSFLEHLAKHFDIDVADERGGEFFHCVPDISKWKRKWHRKNALAGSTNGFPPNLPRFDTLLIIPVKKISLAYLEIDMQKVIEELKNA